MELPRLVFKTHKWLAVGTGLLTFLWFFSGIFMTIPPRLMNFFAERESPTPGRSDYRDSRVSIADAIARLEQETGKRVDVTEVAFRTLQGKLYYRIATAQGTHLVNSQDASLLTINEEMARQIALAHGAALENFVSTTLVRHHTRDYDWGPLPAWHIETNDARRTAYYVEVDGGEVRITHRWGRVLGFLTGMHSLEFLRPYMSRNRIQFLMWVFSIAGTAMTLFGFWILWIQWKVWSRRRLLR